MAAAAKTYSASRNIRIEYSGVDPAAFSPETRGLVAQVVAKTALNIQAKAQKSAPVDTGNLKNSIFAQIGNGPVLLRAGDASKYSAGKSVPGKAKAAASGSAAATGGNPDLPDVANRAQPVTAEVGTGIVYAEFVEFGTVKHPAQPYLFPAVEAARTPFAKALAVVFGRGSSSGSSSSGGAGGTP